MNFEEMTIEALEERKAEIGPAIDAAESEEEVRTLAEEFDAIKAEMERRKSLAAEKAELREKIASGIEEKSEVIEEAEIPQTIEERNTKMDNIEIRKSPEYLDAWVENLKGRATEEQRALLTENATDGTIAVPVYVEDKISTSWESNELMRMVRRTYFPGNLKVGYEASAEGPQVHAEGGEPITEEELVVEYVELIPSMLKKMVRVSDEVIGIKGQAFIDYIFDEIEYQIVKGMADGLITIAASSSVGVLIQEYTAAGAALTAADIVNAEGLLGAEATAPVLFITRAAAASLKAAALSAGYGYDPFDGMPVIYVPAAALSSKLAVIADPSAFQVNLPEGDQVKFKFDDLTEANADMVRIIGRLYSAPGIVAPGRVVRIKAA